MTLRAFSTGRVRPTRMKRGIGRYFRDDWSEATLPIYVFLIDLPGGYCLIDAGQTAEATRTGYFPRWYPFFRLSRFELGPDEEASAQLAAAGVPTSDVRYVVLTHMHTDHVGGIAAFPNAEVVVSRAEWSRAQGLGGRLRGYLPQHWPERRPPTLVDFKGPPVGPFPASHDITGDGRLLLVPLPGHTPGHAAVVVRAGAAHSYLCAGDAAHTGHELTEHAPAVAAWCRAHDITVLTCHDEAVPDLLQGGRAEALSLSGPTTASIVRPH